MSKRRGLPPRPETEPDPDPGLEHAPARRSTGPWSRDRERPPRADDAWLLDLATTLQSTLDLEPLLSLFADRLCARVAFTGLHYRGLTPVESIRLGTEAPCRCGYDLVAQDHHLGTLTLSREEPFSSADIALLDVALAHLVHPLRNSLRFTRALRSATRDLLTGVGNRAGLEQALEREIGLAVRHHRPLSIILMDADDFKAVNDTYGHLAGDRALRALAETVCACARDSDMVFRFGGEEFAVLLSDTPAAGALQLAERIRQHVEALVVRSEEAAIRFTVSLGVAQLQPGQESAAEFLTRVDGALYRAKSGGKNRVANAATVRRGPR